jgi:glycosyltransferase involved in cell wall biosynthesis
MTTLAIITHETIGPRMTGPAIRALELARAVGPDVAARLVSPQPVARDVGGIEARQYRFGDPASMEAALDGADVLLVQGFTLHKFPALLVDERPMVVDLYCPFHLENLERRRLVDPDAASRAFAADVDRAVLVEQLGRGDFFICASDRQRDLWLGMITALGRLTSAVYDGDPNADRWLAVVPFGVDPQAPDPAGRYLRGRHPGIGADDRLIVWGGSVLDWQDPLTPIRAVARVATTLPTVRFVMPAGIPNPEIPPMRALVRAREEAGRLGLTDRHVFFIDWIPYDHRGALLAEADVGVSAHVLTLETRFAWRTRMLDYIWAALPIVCTRGDALADLVETRGLGIVTEPSDAEAMADAFTRLLTDRPLADAVRARLRAERERLAWRTVAAPLRRFCLAPRRLPAAAAAAPPAPRRSPLAGLRRFLHGIHPA